MFVNIIVCVYVIAVSSILQIHAIQLPDIAEIQPSGNDYTVGSLTNTSVLVFSERVNTSGIAGQIVYANFSWFGSANFHKVEALDQNTNETGGFVYSATIEDHFVQLSFRSFRLGGDIDFIVNVFAEPPPGNDLIVGTLTNNSVLVQSERLYAATIPNWYVTIYYDYAGYNAITRIEIIDQNTNGTGGLGRITYGGVSDVEVYLYVASAAVNGSVDFIVNIYVEVESDLTMGYLNAAYGQNVFLQMQTIFESGAPNQYQNASVAFSSGANYTIDVIQALDQSTNGTGGRIQLANGGIRNDNVTLNFTSSALGTAIDFNIIYYGMATNNANNFRMGVFRPGNSLLNSQRVTVPGVPNEYVRAIVNYTGNRVITIIQVFDQFMGGYYLYALNGGVGSNNVTITLESIMPGTGIDIFAEIFGE